MQVSERASQTSCTVDVAVANDCSAPAVNVQRKIRTMCGTNLHRDAKDRPDMPHSLTRHG